ncbi:MAG: glycosyltransferase family 2 protein [Leptolyngbyaceae cyanobacterium MO_188.B28]|nr:glycosyltransferase family 2 protein [Leptolyngbyaceae cyanobacterium MO_188.B28]
MNNQDSSIKTPFVSVIIPCYKQAHFLEQSVKSVLQQTHSNLECLIVDDGSPDNTRQVSEDLMSRDNRVKYLYKENGGLASARNFGVKHAKGAWIQFLDSDDWLHPDKIKFQLSYLQTIDSEIIDAGNILFYSDQENFFEDSDQRILKFLGPMERDQLISRALIPWSIQSACLLINKSIFEKVKYDEIRFKKAMQDVKFIVDLLMNNTNFIYVPIVGVFYRRHSSNVTRSYDLLKDVATNLLKVVQEDYTELEEISQSSVAYHLMQAIEDKNAERLDKLLELTKIPVCLYGIPFRNKSQVKFLYRMRLLVPFVRTVLSPYRERRLLNRKPFLAEIVLEKTSASYTVEEVKLVLTWLINPSGDCPIKKFGKIMKYPTFTLGG